jgi:hypothetical protein
MQILIYLIAHNSYCQKNIKGKNMKFHKISNIIRIYSYFHFDNKITDILHNLSGNYILFHTSLSQPLANKMDP